MTLLATALVNGWIKFKPTIPPKPTQPKHVVYYHAGVVQAKREAGVNHGLRYDGKTRVNRSWPQLAGLTGKQYHRTYMQLLRQERKAHMRDRISPTLA